MPRWKLSVKDRFMSHINKVEETGCWEWTGHILPKGYGHFLMDGKQIRTNRAAYILFVGPIPDGLWALHHCDNRKCANPDHLYLGTLHENVRDAMVRNRMPRGDKNPKRAAFLANGGPNMEITPTPKRRPPGAKLDDEKVRQMRQMFADGYRCVDLANIFNVHTATVSFAITRRTWRHVS